MAMENLTFIEYFLSYTSIFIGDFPAIATFDDRGHEGRAQGARHLRESEAAHWSRDIRWEDAKSTGNQGDSRDL